MSADYSMTIDEAIAKVNVDLTSARSTLDRWLAQNNVTKENDGVYSQMRQNLKDVTLKKKELVHMKLNINNDHLFVVERPLSLTEENKVTNRLGMRNTIRVSNK
jgi:hypothetical protein